jgi:hypothetical protein
MNDTTMHMGQATWYVLNTPMVNCSYETQSLPQFYGAMNTADYAGSAVCGACVEVHAPNTNQNVTIQIVDQCPVSTNPICTSGHIDLNQAAFQQLDNLVTGVIPITWKYVPCNPSGNLVYRFKATTATPSRSSSTRWATTRTPSSFARTTTTSSTPTAWAPDLSRCA